VWRRETYDFRPGESSASKRSTAILPFGEDISKVHDAFWLLKLERGVEVRPFFYEEVRELAKGCRGSPEKFDVIR